MYNHLDQVMVGPITYVYKEMVGTKYHELWDGSKFNADPDFELKTLQDVFTGNTDKNGRVRATVVRKLVDDRYLVSLVVTHVGSGYFSDANYRIFSESEIFPIELDAE